MNYFKVAIKEFPRNKIFQIMLVFIFLIPLIATINLYVSYGFTMKKFSFPILFWPGIKSN